MPPERLERSVTQRKTMQCNVEYMPCTQKHAQHFELTKKNVMGGTLKPQNLVNELNGMERSHAEQFNRRHEI